MSVWGKFNEGFGGPQQPQAQTWPQGGFGGMQGGFDDDPWDNNEGFDTDDFHWNNSAQPTAGGPMFRNPRKARYSEAYGDYRGGYGPGGGFGPRPLFPHLVPPPGPPPGPRPSTWGRGFGPRGPPRRSAEDDKAIKYLMRCGATKDQVKNIGHDILRLIQPEYCGLCDFEFDSFTTSRMHYISKNHLKNQKKWVAKSGQCTSEMPFKARNLYCELCDIQITSQAHGDAHYDGKPHRGIVEGRKKPKNPVLLQAAMEQRVEQLIRREKRCLKPITEKVEEPEAEKDLKNISPELYCNICKTTVTCSDQMTMHMNGKRHLTKEKQHILSLMTGKATASKEGAPEAEKAQEENADGDEWGNETWDNPEEGQDTKAIVIE